MKPFEPEDFFDLSNNKLAAGLFEGVEYVWDAVAFLPAYIENVLRPVILGEVEEGGWLEPNLVRLEKGSRVERGAIVRGPAIIGSNTVIRTGAYIRGHVIIGNECVIGNGTEIRCALVLDQSKVSHQNCVFTSLLGNRLELGGASSTANHRLDGKEIEIKIKVNGMVKNFPTAQTLFGAVIGDDCTIGGMTLFQPGAIVGCGCLICSQCSIHGYIPHYSMVRPTKNMIEIVPKKGPQV